LFPYQHAHTHTHTRTHTHAHKHTRTRTHAHTQTTDKVFKILNDIVGEENIIQVVTDNAANFKTIGDLLMKKQNNCIGLHVLYTILI